MLSYYERSGGPCVCVWTALMAGVCCLIYFLFFLVAVWWFWADYGMLSMVWAVLCVAWGRANPSLLSVMGGVNSRSKPISSPSEIQQQITSSGTLHTSDDPPQIEVTGQRNLSP